MHPSFGIEYICPSTRWEDVIKGPSQAAVLAHTYKILHYRSLFEPGGMLGSESAAELSPDGSRTEATGRVAHYAEAA